LKKKKYLEETIIKETRRLLPYFLKYKTVWSNYDDEADVLYLHFKKPHHANRSEMPEDEVIVCYENNDIIGLSILNESKRTDLNIGVI
jgi:uncharacterized protein YuzE